MKRKFLLSLVSVLTCASILASCTPTNSKTKFYGYWNYDTDIATEGTETLTYSVSPDSDKPFSSINGNYTVQYTSGVYTTVLKTETLEERTVYRYETDLSIDVTFEYSGTTVTQTDTTKSWVQFEKSAENFLRPIASHKEFVSHSPVNSSVTKIEDCYQKFEYSIDTTYASDLKSGNSVIKTTQGETTDSFDIETKKYTFVDFEQLFFAVRGINPTGSASNTTLLSYNAFTGTVQELRVSFASSTADKFPFAKDGEETKSHEITYYPVTLSVKEKNSGPDKTLLVAKHENAKTNEYRNVILQMTTPLAYGMGSLVYKLTSATFSK
jgi:hypothetical protein